MTSEGKTLTFINIQPGTLIARRYDVQERIGQGGMGIVYRCVDRDLNNDVVALKLLQPHLAQDEKVFARFRNEVLVARSLSHPNIVRIHDIGKAEEGYPYISMEFVEGASLADILEKNKPFPFDEAVSILYRVALGVGYAHGRGIVHRDLKPANVMISKSGEIKLADFGMARIAGHSTSLTQTGQAIGTPDYMAPEQIKGEGVDSACDIYALGIISYELVTGVKPFQADSSVAVAYKHLSEPIPDPRAKIESLPEWYVEMLRTAAAKDKADRFSSALAFAEVLAEHCPEVGIAAASTLGTVRVQSPVRADSKSQKVPVAKKVPSAVKQSDRAADVDKPYELGAGSDTVESGEWKFDFGEAGQIDEKKNDGSSKKQFSVLGRLVSAGLFIALLALVFVFVVQGNKNLQSQFAENLPESLHPQPDVDSNLGSVTNNGSLAEGAANGGNAETVSPQSEQEKLDMLLALETSTEPGSVVAGQETTGKAVPEAGSLDVEKVVPPTTSPVLEGTPDAGQVPPSSGVIAVIASGQVGEKQQSVQGSPENSIAEKPSIEKLEPREASMAFRKSGESRAETSFSLDLLSKTEWEATLAGISKEQAQEVVSQLNLKVFDPKSGTDLAKVSARVKTLPSEKDPILHVGGNLAPLEKLHLAPGSVEISLLYQDKVLTKADVSFYRIQTGRIAAATSDSAGVRVLTLPSEDKVESSTARPNTSSLAPEVLVERSTRSPSLAPSLAPSLGQDLPPARRSESQQAASLESFPPEQIQPPVQNLREHYVGSLDMSAQGAGTLGVVLDVEFRETVVQGSATIDSYGTFQVQGSVNRGVTPFGFEMILQNERLGLSLTGSKRTGFLKGRYYIPEENKRGKWEATQR